MLKISITNLDGTLAQFEAAPRILARAANAAVTTVAKRAEREVEKEISRETDIPRRLWAVHRVKYRRKLRQGDALVWIGYNPVKAGYLGQLKQADWGASARSYLFPGSFMARMTSGHVGIFKREGPKRLMSRGRFSGRLKQPIVEEKVHAPQAPIIAARVSAQVGPWFQEELSRQFMRRLKLK